MALLQFDGILLVSDLDGTLLDSRARISKENQAALTYFTAHGGWFTIATGRMEQAVRPYLGELPINVPAILYNGAVLYDFATERRLEEAYLGASVPELVMDLMEEFPGLGVEVYQGGRIYFLRQNTQTEMHRSKEGFVPGLTPFAQIPQPWNKVLLAWEPTQLATVEPHLPTASDEFRTVYSEPHYLELLPAGVSKGSALRQLLAWLQRPALKVVALGDQRNDLELIQAADLGVAVANAHPDLLQVASLVGAHHETHAAAHLIHYLENAWIHGEDMPFLRKDA